MAIISSRGWEALHPGCADVVEGHAVEHQPPADIGLRRTESARLPIADHCGFVVTPDDIAESTVAPRKTDPVVERIVGFEPVEGLEQHWVLASLELIRHELAVKLELGGPA